MDKEYTIEELYKAATMAAVQDSEEEAARSLARNLGLKIKPELPKRVRWTSLLGFDFGGGERALVDMEMVRRYNAVEEALEYAKRYPASEGAVNLRYAELARILREGGR